MRMKLTTMTIIMTIRAFLLMMLLRMMLIAHIIAAFGALLMKV